MSNQIDISDSTETKIIVESSHDLILNETNHELDEIIQKDHTIKAEKFVIKIKEL